MSESAAVPVVPKRRRRWLRFGLRTFLVVVALAGVALGWKLRQVRLQREAVEWVRKNGGTVYYDYEWDAASQQAMLDAKPPGPAWQRSLGGIDLVARPVVASVVTPLADVTQLAKLTGLQTLYLSGTQVQDVTPLAKLMTLQRLYIDGARVADVTPLAKLTALQKLDLTDTPVADVTPLGKLKGLKELLLIYTQVSDVTPLAKLTGLQELDLFGTPVSDESVTELQRALPSLAITR